MLKKTKQNKKANKPKKQKTKKYKKRKAEQENMHVTMMLWDLHRLTYLLSDSLQKMSIPGLADEGNSAKSGQETKYGSHDIIAVYEWSDNDDMSVFQVMILPSE